MEKLLDIAKELDKKFKESDYDLSGFHELAAEFLTKINVEDVTIEKIIMHLNNNELAHQFLSGDEFGEPSITLYNSGEILLDILVWTSNDTNIHSHGFTGAFKTMEGETIQAIYETKNNYTAPYPRVINDEVELKEIKNLKKGAIQKIPTGMGFIHKSFHTKYPTINLIFRTSGVREQEKGLIQHSVYLPNVLLHSFRMSQSLSKKISFINALIKINDPRGKRLLNLLTKTLPENELIGIKERGVGKINFTPDSLKIFYKSVDNEIVQRKLDEKYKSFQTTELLGLNDSQMKSSGLRECTIEALLDCNLSVNQMTLFLKENNFCKDREEVVETIISVISKYNEANLLAIHMNEVAMEIFGMMLECKMKGDIVTYLINEYEAPSAVIIKDVEKTQESIMSLPQLSFLFND